MTQELPEQPGRVPVGELRELVEEWDLRVDLHHEYAYEDCASDLEGVLEKYE